MNNKHIRALDLAREGQWDKAHEIIQLYSDQLSCLIHGYLVPDRKSENSQQAVKNHREWTLSNSRFSHF